MSPFAAIFSPSCFHYFICLHLRPSLRKTLIFLPVQTHSTGHQEKLIFSLLTKSSGGIRCLFVNMLTEYKRGSFCPGSHLQYYALTMDPSGFSASSRPTADSEFSLDLVSVEEDNLVTRSECVCFVCEVQSFPVLLRAAWGSLSFYGLLGSQCR